MQRLLFGARLCSVMRKEETESVGSTAAWTNVETDSDERTRGVWFMKEGEDECEIVIKIMFFHLMTGKKRCTLRATSTSRCWKSQEQLVDVLFRTLTPSMRTMETSMDVKETFPQERVRADLGTQVLEGIMTFLVERNSVRIEDQTVDLPVQKIETENLLGIQRRSSGASFQAHRKAV